jgi:cell division septation protein DedD
MRGVFDDEESEHVSHGRDTELTLSTGMLLMLLFGLVLVCGFCFGLGYFVGHRGAETAVAPGQAPAGARASSQAGSSVPKPSATAAAAVPQPAPADDASQPGSGGAPQAPAAVSVPVVIPQAANSSTSTAPSNSQPQVRPALPAMTGAQQSVPANSAVPAQPANSGAAVPLMVQIAAVSHVEDAKVLSEALRKRGYTVTARREPADDLIHVRIGPFATREEANSWRMKLLNDGYNAMIQP